MNAIAPVPANDDNLPDSMLNFVARAVRDPSIDVAKLQVLLAMQREIVADDARLQYIRAMAAAQSEMVPVVRDATNDQTRSKYARLETIDAAIRPIYTKHGFTLEFDSESIDGPNERIVCFVSHTAGHGTKRQLEAAPDTQGPKGLPNKTQLHGLASTVSYLRRYLTCMIFNIVLKNDDNDGNRTRPNEDGELTGRVQIEQLAQLIAECSADPLAIAANERRFLAAFNFHDLKTIKDIPVGEFPRLKTALLGKKKVLAQRAAANTQTRTGAAA